MDFIIANQAALASFIGFLLLLILILYWRANAFISLLACAIITALLAGMTPEKAFSTLQSGMGGTLGFIAPIIGLGALFGAIMEKSGYLEILAMQLGGIKTDKRRVFAIGFMGLIAAIPVFFDVALIILLPFIMKLARKAGKAPLFFGLPLCAGLAIGHAFIPPTPGPIAIAELIGANLGQVIIIGSLISLACLIISGPVLTLYLDKTNRLPVPTDLISTNIIEATIQMPETMPSDKTSSDKTSSDKPSKFTTALGLMLLPLILIMAGTVGKFILADSGLKTTLSIIGHPFSALIIACIVSWFFLDFKSSEDKLQFQNTLSKAFEPTALVILVTGAGGAFKQVLVDTGAGAQMAEGLLIWGLTPILLAYLLALLIRIVQGSATVAMITAAGLVAPILLEFSLNSWQLAIITSAIAAGATGVSHVNDSGFWLVSRLFHINERQTLQSWTVMTSLISVTGLIVSLGLYTLF